MSVNHKHRNELWEKLISYKISSKYGRCGNSLFVLKFATVILMCTVVVSSCTSTNKNEKSSTSQLNTPSTNTQMSNDEQFASPSVEEMVMFCSDNKFGFMDLSGHTVIEPKFDYISHFHEGRAIAGTKKERKYGFIKYGFINLKGEWIVPPIYDDVKDFNEGMAAVYLYNEGWGFVDISGNLIVPPMYGEVRSFSNGMAAVFPCNIDEGDWCDWGFIDNTGDVAIALTTQNQSLSVKDFSKDGTAVVHKVHEDDIARSVSAVIDKQGNIIIPFDYSHISDPWQGIRVASPQDEMRTGKSSGLIDSSGNWLVEPIYFEMGNIKDGLVRACIVREGLAYEGILKMDGSWLYEPIHNSVYSFQNNMIVFVDSNGKFSVGTMMLYDLNGNQLLKGKNFDKIDILTENLVLCGDYVDSEGNMDAQVYYADSSLPVAEDMLTYAYQLENGVIVACVGEHGNETWGIPDLNGGWLIPPLYYKILTFNGDKGAGIRIIDDKSTNDKIVFVTEIFNQNGEVIYSSQEEYMDYDDFVKIHWVSWVN